MGRCDVDVLCFRVLRLLFCFSLGVTCLLGLTDLVGLVFAGFVCS